MDSGKAREAEAKARASAAVFALWALVVAPVVLLDVLVVVAFVVALRSESQLTMVLEVLRVAVAWPMVVLAIAVAFGLAFRPEIGDAIKRIVIKVANVEIGTRQTEKEVATSAAGSPGEVEASAIEATVVTAKATEATVPVIAPTKTAVSVKAEKSVDAELKLARELGAVRMRHWWWWWLQVVQIRLIPRTVLVLRWLLEQPEATAATEAYDQHFRPMINVETKDAELTAMFNILLQYNLVSSPPSRATMTITDSGRKFLNYLDGKWNPLEDATIV